MNYQLEKIKLNLKVNWKISRNESLSKENFLLKGEKFTSEIAPNIRYGENEEIIVNNFKDFLNNPHQENSLWCQSFKNAFNNLKLKERYNGDLFRALGLRKINGAQTSFSIPIMSLDRVGEYIEKNDQFHFYKIKIDAKDPLALIHEVSKHTKNPLRIDANEAFTDLDGYLRFEARLKDFNIDFIEQPFPAKFIHEYESLKSVSNYEVIADESVIDFFDEKLFQKSFHGLNVKIMKTGGVENAKRILLKAKEFGMKTMIGCMIESSLGISEAFSLAELADYIDLDGALLINNDPFKELYRLKRGHLYF